MSTCNLALVLSLAILPAARAQEPAPQPAPPAPKEETKPEPKKDRVVLPPMPGATSGNDDLQKEMLELFAKVELRLRAIDTQMYEAAAGRVPTKAVAGSGIEELLRSKEPQPLPQNVGELLKSASQDSEQTQSDIQRILRIAEQLDSNSKKQGSGQGQGEPKPSSGGKSPLDGQNGKQPQGREQTPEGPGSKPENSKPEPGQGEEPQDGKQPDDPNKPTENRAGNQPPSSAKGPGTTANEADRWGDLPVRAREIFRVEGASDLPPQYRDWIDGYYRRLQSLERR